MYKYLLVILLFPTITSGQFKKIKSFSISDTVVYATVDRPGDFYILTTSGQIQKFDTHGRLINLYKSHVMPSITLFDPRDGSRMFAYFRDLQVFWFMNPSFEVNKSYRLDSALTLEPWLITPSGEHNLWIFDAAEMSLKKLETKHEEIIVEEVLAFPETEKKDFILLREYQNFVFLLNKTKGIYIFNSMGKLLRVVQQPNLTYFNFLGEELYYLNGQKLIFLDLFNLEKREVYLPKAYDFALLTDERLFTVKKNNIEIFEVKR